MREANKLSARKVASLKEPGRYGDGLGLELQISKWGTKSWSFRYTMDGRTRQMGLGPIHTVNLAEARERARQARQAILDGVDPIEAKRQARDARRALSFETMTFEDAVARFLEVHSETWRNAKHRQQWANTLRDYARPLNDRPVSAIDGALITDTLASIWTSKPETARRTKQRIERVWAWVKNGMPLPVQGAAKRGNHHAALPFAELPGFMADLRQKESISARALEFTILTAARTGETIGARWDEIDLDSTLWTVPAERMKGGREHVVPLSARAVALLRGLPRERGNNFVFPGAKPGAGLSNMALLQLVRGMREGLTTHGFRSTFRDWAGDRSTFPRDVIEHALAHRLPDRVEAAYRRSSALEKRAKLMEAWSRFCSSPTTGGKIVPLRAAI